MLKKRQKLIKIRRKDENTNANYNKLGNQQMIPFPPTPPEITTITLEGVEQYINDFIKNIYHTFREIYIYIYIYEIEF